VAQETITQILSAFSDETRVTAPPAIPVIVESLTNREFETLRFLATDLVTGEIADEMDVTIATVRTHTKHIFSKLDVHSRYESVQRAKDLGLL